MAGQLDPTHIQRIRASIIAMVAAEADKSILKPAQELAPVDTGRMRQSGRIVVHDSGNSAVVNVTFGKDDDGDVGFENGAPSNQYVMRQHEDMALNHPRGGQAKFLKTAADKAQPGFAARVAARITGG